jgi:hypothetical protein
MNGVYLMEFLVADDKVVIIGEEQSQVRRIWTDGRGFGDEIDPTYNGTSIGHWEGKTLVVETIGQPDADRDHIAPFLIVPGEATVIERFTPVSDRELLYQFTVVDPKVYSAPWLGEFSWFRTTQPMYEHACHEGNYSLANILAGARHTEAVAKAAGGQAGH